MNKESLFDANEVTISNRYLHTPSEFARKNLIYVQEVGKLKSIKPHSCIRKNLQSFLFFIVTGGCGEINSGSHTYKLKTGDCVFIDCENMYEHRSDAENQWELMWVHMYGSGLQSLYNIFLEKNGGNIVFSAESIRRYEEIIEKIMELQNDKDMAEEYVTHAILTQLVMDIIVDSIHRGNNSLNPDILNNIRNSINERYKEDDLLESICSEYGFDEIEVNRMFKEKFGIDLCDYILNRRFTCAKELLRFSVMPIKDIIKESGIMNADLFRHLFIEKEGMTAEEYRRKWAQWNRG